MLSMINRGERTEDDAGSGKHFMDTEDFDRTPISYNTITALMNHKLKA